MKLLYITGNFHDPHINPHTMFKRIKENTLLALMRDYPCVAITGARQVGKTTLAREITASWPDNAVYLDMESPRDLARLQEPELYLEQNEDQLIVIDEIQHRPDLFPVLRSVIDRNRRNGRFLILGSASPELIRDSSESLAGRIAYEELHGLSLTEVVQKHDTHDVWLRGGFPQALTSKNDKTAMRWLQDFLYTVTARDLPILGLNTDLAKLRMFFTMLAQQQGGLMNRETMARSTGVSATTINRYLYYLEHIYLIRQLQPWHVNAKKRLVKSPKVYIRDSGLLHAIIGIENYQTLRNHIAVGGSWEGFVIEQTGMLLPESCGMYFYRTHQGAEADLLIVKDGKPIICTEIKRTDAPSMSKGFSNVIEDNRTSINFIIHTGDDEFPVAKNVQAIGFLSWLERVRSL